MFFTGVTHRGVSVSGAGDGPVHLLLQSGRHVFHLLDALPCLFVLFVFSQHVSVCEVDSFQLCATCDLILLKLSEVLVQNTKFSVYCTDVTHGELFGVNQPRGQKIKALGNLGRGPDPPLVSCLLTEQCDANWSAKRRPPLHQQPRQSQCL